MYVDSNEPEQLAYNLRFRVQQVIICLLLLIYVVLFQRHLQALGKVFRMLKMKSQTYLCCQAPSNTHQFLQQQAINKASKILILLSETLNYFRLDLSQFLFNFLFFFRRYTFFIKTVGSSFSLFFSNFFT